jgi:hypothetical protein
MAQHEFLKLNDVAIGRRHSPRAGLFSVAVASDANQAAFDVPLCSR